MEELCTGRNIQTSVVWKLLLLGMFAHASEYDVYKHNYVGVDGFVNEYYYILFPLCNQSCESQIL